MTPTAPDARVRLDTHPTHDSAVVATVTGPEAQELVAVLEADAWHLIAEDTLVLVRIDREEPYWARKAAQGLTADGITVDIRPRLREAMAEEWTWAAYPMPWCSRAEIREVSDQAQQIYDALRHGRLRIHAHAHDGHTTVAVGTYPDGESIHLHGEDHLRVESYTYGSAEGARDEATTDLSSVPTRPSRLRVRPRDSARGLAIYEPITCRAQGEAPHPKGTRFRPPARSGISWRWPAGGCMSAVPERAESTSELQTDSGFGSCGMTSSPNPAHRRSVHAHARGPPSDSRLACLYRFGRDRDERGAGRRAVSPGRNDRTGRNGPGLERTGRDPAP